MVQFVTLMVTAMMALGVKALDSAQGKKKKKREITYNRHIDN